MAAVQCRWSIIEVQLLGNDVAIFQEGCRHLRWLTTLFCRYYGPEFIAQELRHGLERLGTATLYIEPGSLWENGYCESFNGKLRHECLNGEMFYSGKEAQLLIEQWRQQYNTRAATRGPWA